MINMDDVNISWYQWKDVFFVVVQDYIFKKNIKGCNNLFWINGDIVYVFRKKEFVRQKFLSFLIDFLWVKFREFRVKVKNMIKESWINFFNFLDFDFCNNLKRFWLVFKFSSKEFNFFDIMLMGVGEGVLILICMVLSFVDIVFMFNEYFMFVFSIKDYLDLILMEFELLDYVLCDVSFIMEDVLEVLLVFDFNKVIGLDGIFCCFFKEIVW